MNRDGKILWLTVAAVLMTGFVLAAYVHSTTTQIQEALAEEVLQQQHDVANLLHEYAGVMIALERLQLLPQNQQRTEVESSLAQAQLQLQEMRSNYSFQRLDGAATAHAFVRPILEDVGQWLSDGIPGYDANQPIVLEMAAKRLSDRYPALRTIATETDDVATKLITAQSGYLEKFRSSLLLLFAGFSVLTFAISVLLVRQRNLQTNFARTQKHHAQRFKDFADAGADMFWESDASLKLKILSGDVESTSNSFVLNSSVREDVYPNIATGFNGQQARGPWPVKLMELQSSFYDVEAEWITPDGIAHVVSISGKPVLDAKSRYSGYRGVGRNITDRKKMECELRRANELLVEAESRGREQAELALRESEQFHRTILDALPLNIVILDTEGTIKAVNTAWKHFLNTANLDIDSAGVGLNYRAVYELFSTHEQEGLKRAIQRIDDALTSSYKTESNEFGFSVAGTDYWFVITTTSFDSSQTRFTVLVHEDVTDRIHLQERDRQLQAELAQASRINIAGELASGLAHELNQPLTAISHNCDALISIIRESTAIDNEVNEIVTDVYNQSHRTGDIIRSMRRLIRKDSGLKLAVDINELARETIRLIQAEARDKNIKIQLQLAENLPQPIVDTVQVQQVLINLERNSIESMGGTNSNRKILTLSTELADNNTILISVQDTGSGFSTTMREQLFSAFVTTKKGGMGLGLSISRTIIEAQGGLIWLDESCEDQTVIRFTIPVERG